MDRVKVGEIELCYELSGNRSHPAMVLVCGMGSNIGSWSAEFVELLVDHHFCVLRFDNRDSGMSTILEDAPRFNLRAAARRDEEVVTYTLDEMADDLAGLLTALGLGPAHLIGVSLGGMIAQMAAVRHPDQTASLCSIMSTTGGRDVGQATPEAAALLVKTPAKGRDGFVEGELDNMRILGSTRPALIDLEWRRAKEERLYDQGIHPRGTGRQFMAVIASGDRTDALATIRVPTLVIHGDADPLISMSGGEATAAAIPDAELMIIPGLGHELPPAVWPLVVPAIVANARRGENARAALAETGEQRP